MQIVFGEKRRNSNIEKRLSRGKRTGLEKEGKHAIVLHPGQCDTSPINIEWTDHGLLPRDLEKHAEFWINPLSFHLSIKSHNTADSLHLIS